MVYVATVQKQKDWQLSYWVKEHENGQILAKFPRSRQGFVVIELAFGRRRGAILVLAGQNLSVLQEFKASQLN